MRKTIHWYLLFLQCLIPVNAAQAKILVALAKEKRLFLLEAVWTRFFPLSIEIRKLISSGALGRVMSVFADFGVNFSKEELGLKHRIYNPDLAGGSLLDMGLYSLTWVMQTIYDAQKGRGETPNVTGGLVPVKETGVDESACVVLTWNDGISLHYLPCYEI
jgi:predicted dehydrogenase